MEVPGWQDQFPKILFKHYCGHCEGFSAIWLKHTNLATRNQKYLVLHCKIQWLQKSSANQVEVTVSVRLTKPWIDFDSNKSIPVLSLRRFLIVESKTKDDGQILWWRHSHTKS